LCGSEIGNDGSIYLLLLSDKKTVNGDVTKR
jgi:hypothetical protein